MESPKRLQQLEELFHEALGLEPKQRAAFIARARESNPQLADAVESLIAAHERPGSFIDRPAVEAVAEMTTDSQPQLKAGQIIGHYQIIAPLGKGGMGDVYLANDPKLGRKVALKLLPAEFTGSKERLLRFVQEAKAASSLNHPNIITIHEIGEAEGAHFIATEFIDGQTLKHLMALGRMKLYEILDVSIQTANALQSAHAAGIVHRDIKPENIMVRRDGYVKILDFGLAKLNERPGQSTAGSSNIDTMLKVHTNPGTVLGTVKYMSPEQARGQVLDQRTDVFSFGVVLYEMAAGRIPFSGETSMDTLVSILQNEPAPLEEFAPETPPEFQRIVSKALRKDREERYQTIKDLLIDLKSLKEELSFQQKLDRSRPPKSAIRTPEPAKTLESAAPPTQSIQRPGRSRLIGGLLLIGVLVIGGALLWSRKSSPTAPVVTQTAAPAFERAITYWITVQKYRDGKPYQDPFRLADNINFEKDYRIRLNLRSSQNGRLYLLNEGPERNDQAPAFIVMFPSTTANKGSEILTANQEIQIPEQSWFSFDEQQGTEKIWLVWSEKEIPELEAVKNFANPTDRGVISSPDLRGAINKFLHNAKPVSVARDEEKKDTLVQANSEILVHIIKLEHH
jgi:serine/threonine protein kinase